MVFHLNVLAPSPGFDPEPEPRIPLLATIAALLGGAVFLGLVGAVGYGLYSGNGGVQLVGLMLLAAGLSVLPGGAGLLKFALIVFALVKLGMAL